MKDIDIMVAWFSIGYEDLGPMWLCTVVIISECLVEHALSEVGSNWLFQNLGNYL